MAVRYCSLNMVCVFQVGDDWYLEGCKEECVCLDGGVIQCHNTTCTLTESCGLQDGELGCYPLGTTHTHTHTNRRESTDANVIFFVCVIYFTWPLFLGVRLKSVFG